MSLLLSNTLSMCATRNTSCDTKLQVAHPFPVYTSAVTSHEPYSNCVLLSNWSKDKNTKGKDVLFEWSSEHAGGVQFAFEVFKSRFLQRDEELPKLNTGPAGNMTVKNRNISKTKRRSFQKCLKDLKSDSSNFFHQIPNFHVIFSKSGFQNQLEFWHLEKC